MASWVESGHIVRGTQIINKETTSGAMINVELTLLERWLSDGQPAPGSGSGTQLAVCKSEGERNEGA